MDFTRSLLKVQSNSCLTALWNFAGSCPDSGAEVTNFNLNSSNPCP